ncbi:MAG: hypothetical protein AAF098_19180 [Pseudomonadota bacterium]
MSLRRWLGWAEEGEAEGWEEETERAVWQEESGWLWSSEERSGREPERPLRKLSPCGKGRPGRPGLSSVRAAKNANASGLHRCDSFENLGISI